MKLLQQVRLIWFTVMCGSVISDVSLAEGARTEGSMLVYIGTYTGAKSKGVYVSRLDPATGKLSTPELAVETKSPSFLAVHPNHRFLYAVSEVNKFEGKPEGGVSAFGIDSKTGKLSLINQQRSGGTGPCHLEVDGTGKCVLVANYGSGSLAALPIHADGKLAEPSAVIQHEGSSVNPQRQAGPHAHFIIPDPANRFALACDLGLDKVLIYQLDPVKGSLIANSPPSIAIKPGSGPRHLAFHPNGQVVYLINEMSSTLITMAYDAQRGALEELQTISTLPEKYGGESSCAEVQVHPSGRFVYGSNRGHDSIAVFAADPKTGKLTFVEHQPTKGKTPRHFGIDPSGKWLLAENQGSDTIVVFRIDSKSGRLSAAGQSVEVGAPACVVFVGLK
jgi:6-phosphogluconolactonase